MEKILGPTGKHHSGPDNKAVGNGRNGVTAENGDKILKNLGQAAAEAGKTAAISKNTPDLFKDVRQIKENIKENIQYPKYGDSDSQFLEGKDEGEFTMYKGKPPYRLKTKELTTGKTFYQGDK